MSKIVFVVDGNAELGMGHVIHSLALAEELRDKADIVLVTQSGPEVTAIWKGFTTYNTKNVKAKLKGIAPQVVVIDNLYVDSGFAEWVRFTLGARLIICNCLSNEVLTMADLVVAGDAMGLHNRRVKALVYDRQNPRQFADYSSLWLTGPRYWVLRRDFDKLYPQVRAERAEKILLSFGGVNQQDMTDKVYSFVAKGFDVVKLHHNLSHASDWLSNVSPTMQRADLVICSPGLTPFEALLVGTPVIIIPQNEEQEVRYKPYLPLLGKDEIDKLPGMIERGEFIRSDSPIVQQMQIGQGKREVVEAIEAWL